MSPGPAPGAGPGCAAARRQPCGRSRPRGIQRPGADVGRNVHEPAPAAAVRTAGKRPRAVAAGQPVRLEERAGGARNQDLAPFVAQEHQTQRPVQLRLDRRKQPHVLRQEPPRSAERHGNHTGVVDRRSGHFAAPRRDFQPPQPHQAAAQAAGKHRVRDLSLIHI